MIDVSAVLETERLLLRPHTMEDLEPLHAIISHPDVYKYDPGYARTLAQTREILEFRMAEFKRHGLGRLAVIEKATRDLIGYAGLQLCLFDEPRFTLPGIEFFYGLRRDRWGQGFITEAGRALIAHGFRDLRLPRIAATAHRENAPSINVMRRVGMTICADPCYPDDWVFGVIENKLV